MVPRGCPEEREHAHINTVHGVQHASDPTLKDSKLLDLDIELCDKAVHLLLTSASHTCWVAHEPSSVHLLFALGQS